MEAEHDQDDDRPQIAQSQAGGRGRHRANAPSSKQIQTGPVLPLTANATMQCGCLNLDRSAAAVTIGSHDG
jgi:hypothetical protein